MLVFDAAKPGSGETFAASNQLGQGVDCLLVNEEIRMQDDRLTAQLPSCVAGATFLLKNKKRAFPFFGGRLFLQEGCFIW